MEAFESTASIYARSPFGEPFRDVTVFFLARENEGEIQLGQAQTDANGLARLAIGDREVIEAHVRLGTGDFGYGFLLFTPEVNFTVAYRLGKLG